MPLIQKELAETWQLSYLKYYQRTAKFEVAKCLK